MKTKPEVGSIVIVYDNSPQVLNSCGIYNLVKGKVCRITSMDTAHIGVRDMRNPKCNSDHYFMHDREGVDWDILFY